MEQINFSSDEKFRHLYKGKEYFFDLRRIVTNDGYEEEEELLERTDDSIIRENHEILTEVVNKILSLKLCFSFYFKVINQKIYLDKIACVEERIFDFSLEFPNLFKIETNSELWKLISEEGERFLISLEYKEIFITSDQKLEKLSSLLLKLNKNPVFRRDTQGHTYDYYTLDYEGGKEKKVVLFGDYYDTREPLCNLDKIEIC